MTDGAKRSLRPNIAAVLGVAPTGYSVDLELQVVSIHILLLIGQQIRYERVYSGLILVSGTSLLAESDIAIRSTLINSNTSFSVVIKDIPAQWAKIGQGLDIFRISSKCVCLSNGKA